MLPKSNASCSFSGMIIRSNLDLYCTYCSFIQNMFSKYLAILAWSFPRIVLMNCEETDFIETL